ncbi:MAG: SMP-30/gluconolactonase/LRE family protein [Bacteroidota bacterium]
MTKSVALLLLFAITAMDAGAQTTVGADSVSVKKTSSLIADGAVLQLISNQFSFTEGPATDKQGNVFFTDQPNNKIWKYDTSGKLSVFLEKAGRSNGMYFDDKGNLVTCADEENQLWSISSTGEVTVLLKDLDGLHFNGPNDLWIHPDGGIYFTDPYYQRDYWTRKSAEMNGEKVYYLKKNKAPVVVADNLAKPNGIIGTPDGRWLYVADIKANKTYRYKIAKDHSLTEQTLFAPMGSDGMTIDELGNIYLTGKGITVYNPEGQLLEHIAVPGGWTANITFGGKERNIAFITASKAVYVLPMKVKGVQ